MPDRRIVLTGATGGMGRVAARTFAEDGERLVLVDLDAERLAEMRDELLGLGAPAVETAACDFSRPAEVADLADALATEPVDCLANIAGLAPMVLLEDLTLEVWDRVFAINLVAPFLLCRSIGLAMAARGSGRIVNIASIVGKRGGAGQYEYAAAKAGVISLTQSMAARLGPDGVTVNAICPGPVWTPMLIGAVTWFAERSGQAGRTTEDLYDEFVQNPGNMLRKPTRTEDIVAAMRFLFSDAAERITGQAINVDAGHEVH